ncbi:hypothetical protein GQX74_011132 [Glossina fuscipes]|nr:hypothetical protein GQX74_011132 [Glossina fuscipes]
MDELYEWAKFASKGNLQTNGCVIDHLQSLQGCSALRFPMISASLRKSSASSSIAVEQRQKWRGLQGRRGVLVIVKHLLSAALVTLSESSLFAIYSNLLSAISVPTPVTIFNNPPDKSASLSWFNDHLKKLRITN